MFHFHGILSVEITNHGSQIKQIPRHSLCSIPESRLDLFCIPNHALFLAKSRITQDPLQTLFNALNSEKIQGARTRSNNYLIMTTLQLNVSVSFPLARVPA